MNDLLEILCCPETYQRLAMAEPELIARLNAAIQSGQLKNRGGKPVTAPMDAGFVREDRKFLYLIRGSIPVLLIDESIPLE